jgi:hypothetical protein
MIAMAVGVSSAAMLLPSPAAAQESKEPTVDLFVDFEAADVRVESKTFRTSCGAPCALKLPGGYYTVTTPEASKEIFLDRPTHVGLTRGSPAFKTLSLVLLLTGVVVTVVAVAVPLVVCRRGDREVDQFGRQYTPPNPCSDASDGLKVAWIAGGGAGLTLGLVGGIGLAISGPRLTLTF